MEKRNHVELVEDQRNSEKARTNSGLRFLESTPVFHSSSIERTEKPLRESNYQVLAVLEPIDVGISLSKISAR